LSFELIKGTFMNAIRIAHKSAPLGAL
jgi:hypothetical protein